jgi:hypothetical protein
MKLPFTTLGASPLKRISTIRGGPLANGGNYSGRVRQTVLPQESPCREWCTRNLPTPECYRRCPE